MQGKGAKPQANEALRDLGHELRSRREQLGRTTAEAEATLKIRRRYLTALEAGEADSFPGVVYQLGFLRAYADYLGLDGEQLAARCRQALEPSPPAPPGPAARKQAASRPPPVRTEAPRPVAVVPQPRAERPREPELETVPSLAAAAGQRHRRSTSKTAPSPAPARAPARRGALRFILIILVLVAVVALWYTVARAPGPQNGQAGTGPPASGDPPASTQPPPPPELPPAFGPDRIAVLADSPGEIRYQVKADALTVTVRLTDRVWIRVVADGEELISGTREAGFEAVFRAVDVLSLRTGRASNTRCSVFEVDLGPAGPQDDARTVVFVRKT